MIVHRPISQMVKWFFHPKFSPKGPDDVITWWCRSDDPKGQKGSELGQSVGGLPVEKIDAKFNSSKYVGTRPDQTCLGGHLPTTCPPRWEKFIQHLGFADERVENIRLQSDTAWKGKRAPPSWLWPNSPRVEEGSAYAIYLLTGVSDFYQVDFRA